MAEMRILTAHIDEPGQYNIDTYEKQWRLSGIAAKQFLKLLQTD